MPGAVSGAEPGRCGEERAGAVRGGAEPGAEPGRCGEGGARVVGRGGAGGGAGGEAGAVRGGAGPAERRPGEARANRGEAAAGGPSARRREAGSGTEPLRTPRLPSGRRTRKRVPQSGRFPGAFLLHRREGG